MWPKMVKMDHIQSTSLNLFPTLVTEVDLNPILNASDVCERIFSVGNEAVKWGLFGNSVSTLPRVQPTYGKPSLKWLEEMPKYNLLEQPEFQDVRAAFDVAFADYAKKAGLLDLEQNVTWFNYSMDGSNVNNHRHRNATVSLTYYPSFPKGASKLIVKAPHLLHFETEGEHHFINDVDSDKPTEYNYFEHELQIKEGHAYIFPGWMYHYANASEATERITIASIARNKKTYK